MSEGPLNATRLSFGLATSMTALASTADRRGLAYAGGGGCDFASQEHGPGLAKSLPAQRSKKAAGAA
jgi:hypothetical protein